jgi:hypothetical protein
MGSRFTAGFAIPFAATGDFENDGLIYQFFFFVALLLDFLNPHALSNDAFLFLSELSQFSYFTSSVFPQKMQFENQVNGQPRGQIATVDVTWTKEPFTFPMNLSTTLR